MIFGNFFKKGLFFLPWCDKESKAEAKLDKSAQIKKSYSDEYHLKSTTDWLLRSNNANNDSGVSRAYKASRCHGYGPYGWQVSYPETTGYIIPTIFLLAKILGDSSLSERAVRMADWEVDIQLPSGAVMGSVVTAPPSPAVFNTGQVMFGWLAAYRETGKPVYLDSATKAADYLLSVQKQNGSWEKGDSKFAIKGATTYNTRVAWALIELGQETGNIKYIESGQRFLDFALTQQHPNGWFSQNCLNDPERPLLHTIVYATRGFLESGICLNEQKYIDAGMKTLDALMKCQRTDGGIPGRLSADWSSQADWDCVTGDAQAAVAWLRAHAITGNSKYKDAARKATEFVKRTQNLEHANPGIRGGVKGSFPFDGPYGQFEMLNWAAKFFCDALIMINDEKLAEKGIKG
jgi:uncharacterized protein YyaL (SSP411 family)